MHLAEPPPAGAAICMDPAAAGLALMLIEDDMDEDMEDEACALPPPFRQVLI